MLKFAFVLLCLIVVSTVLMAATAKTDSRRALLDAIRKVESQDGKRLVGDNGKAIGPYQIWKSYWQDAVDHDKSIGGVYRDCMEQEYSEKVILAYWDRYGGLSPTDEKLARIHNGGPKIMKRQGTEAWRRTTVYWTKVKAAMEAAK